MTQVPASESENPGAKPPPPKAALVGLSVFLGVACLFTLLMTAFQLHVSINWTSVDAPVIGHETNVSTSKRRTQTTYRPIFEVIDESGKKSRAVSRTGYGSTDGIEVGTTHNIKHNGTGGAQLNTFGTRFAIPLIGMIVCAFLGFLVYQVYQKRQAAAASLNAGQEIQRQP
jgi:hypothetical protein